MATMRPVRASLAAVPGAQEPMSAEVGSGPEVLDRLDDRHAVLRRPGWPPVAVLLLPAASTRRPAGSRGQVAAGSRGQVAARSPAAAPGTALLEVIVDGWRFDVIVEDAGRAELRERAARGHAADGPARPSEVRAIIPGRIAAISVIVGQPVAQGDPLLVIEAMKMQNDLRAPRSGMTAIVAVRAGQTVEAGDLLVVIE